MSVANLLKMLEAEIKFREEHDGMDVEQWRHHCWMVSCHPEMDPKRFARLDVYRERRGGFHLEDFEGKRAQEVKTYKLHLPKLEYLLD